MGYCRRRNGKRLVWQIKAPSMIFTAFYRGFHHGALSFSRSIRFTSGALPFRALSWFSPRCILFYRGLYHGALSSRVPSGSHLVHSVLSDPHLVHFAFRVLSWSQSRFTLLSLYRGVHHGACSFCALSGSHLVHSVISWSSSRCTFLSRSIGSRSGAFRSIVVSITVHFSFRVISWISTPRCMPAFLSWCFYHGALNCK